VDNQAIRAPLLYRTTGPHSHDDVCSDSTISSGGPDTETDDTPVGSSTAPSTIWMPRFLSVE
jgi:hypothetical protein